jgi:uncharacterized protein YcbX
MSITVTQLLRYPVKSMGGHALDAAALNKKGIPGDRAWTLKDEERGGIKGGKRFPQLMGMRAAFVSEPTAAVSSPEVRITLNNGDTISSSDPNVNAVLSEQVGAPVSLWPLLPEDQLDHYRRAALDPDVDAEAYFREVFARNPDEPLPDLSLFPEELFIYESSPGTYFDAFPILLMTQASLDYLQALKTTTGDDCNFDLRRFRPNIVVNTPDTGFIENSWVGRRARLGSAIIKVETVCPRCIMTTHGFEDLPSDPRIMRHLVRENGGNLGVYLSIEEPGSTQVGDGLEWLE